ncbi:MAG: M42 family metallopeptidase [Clostridia bacterium]|nr:M42 family metallopeptidase [Clostridia bacterium]
MLLAKLSEVAGISGQEAEVREAIRAEIAPYVDEITVDAIGNLVALKRGRGTGVSGGRRVMLAAHMDEVGLMVKGFESDGLLRVASAGGVDPRVLVSKMVYVGRGSEKHPGVIGSKPIHLLKREDMDRATDIKSLYVDIGASSKEEASKLVQIGDPISFATKCEPIGEGFIRGKAFDDRAGCCGVIEALKAQHDFDLYGAFTVQEEVGLRGAGVAAFRIKPDLALVLEGTTAHDIPKAPEHAFSTVPGKGPAIVHRDASWIGTRSVIDRLVATAQAAGVPYQFKRSVTGGTDAGRIGLTEAGIPAAVMSVPCRFIHSPVSVMSISDFENYVKLAGLFLDSLDEGGLPLS